MMLFESLIKQAVLFALIVSRVGGFVAVSPFPGNHVSVTQRVGLVLCLSWVASTFATQTSVPTDFGVRLVAAALLEVGCGLVVGFVFRLVFSACEVLGVVLSQATGLSSPSILNPTIEAHDTVLSRIVTVLALLLALEVGAQRVALTYVLESFRALPVGGPTLLPAATEQLVNLAGESMIVGVRLGTPVLAVGLVVQLALALISRAAPSLQIFSIGITVLLASGMVTLLASAHAIVVGLASHFSTLGQRVLQIVSALPGGHH